MNGALWWLLICAGAFAVIVVAAVIEGTSTMIEIIRDRLTAGHRTLTAAIVVRIHVPEPKLERGTR
jgi:hypothetical protein